MSSSRLSAAPGALTPAPAVAAHREEQASELSLRASDMASRARASGSVRIAYLVNQYPKVSHSFIRREIQALERRGLLVDRYAVRGWDAELVDPDDRVELKHTHFLLEGGLLPLALATVRTLVKQPAAFLAGLRLALRRARRSDRAIHYHLAYLAQACLLLERLRATPVAHLHAHFGTNSAEIALLTRLLGGPAYSFTAHGTEEIDRGLALGLDEKVSHAAFAVAVSDFTRSQLFRYVKAADWSKIAVVHCGLEQSFYGGDTPPVSSPDRLVCVGRISAEKGHLILIEALARAVQAGRNCRVVLVGDGEMRSLVERRAAELGMADRVEITGWVSSGRVREEILAARALVLPSFLEGLPVVLMEAMALRRPVIASGVAGIPELVLGHQTGWLVPPGNVASLTSAIIECIDMPDIELRRMAEAAYARVIDRHAIDREAAKLAWLFSSAGTPGHATGPRCLEEMPDLALGQSEHDAPPSVLSRRHE